MKSYSTRSNCVRAAKVALGPEARPGTHFDVLGDPPALRWVPKGDTIVAEGLPASHSAPHAANGAATAAKAPRATRTAKGAPRVRKEKGEARLRDQKRMQMYIALAKRPEGVTTVEASKIMGVTTDTVRGAYSRLRADDVPITVGKPFKVRHYHLAASWRG